MSQTAIPYVMMRGGTSRGLYIDRAHLPADGDTLAEVLIAAVGAGHPINIDGLGGGVAVTTKVAMLSRATDPWAEIDYFFAQVGVGERLVDFAPSCGNILAGVGPAACELGLARCGATETLIRIHSVNTGARIESRFASPDQAPRYDGATAIDGVPGTASPVRLDFRDVVGSKTGQLLPTGSATDVIEGFEVSCVDAAVPLVIGRAGDFGIEGTETRAALDANRELFARIEAVRIAAGEKMGLGDVVKSVVPRFALLSPPRSGGSVTSRYFMPWAAHPSHSITGGICVAACCLIPGSIADGLAAMTSAPDRITVEHPSGRMELAVDYRRANGALDLRTIGVISTTRKLASGHFFVPTPVWSGHAPETLTI